MRRLMVNFVLLPIALIHLSTGKLKRLYKLLRKLSGGTVTMTHYYKEIEGRDGKPAFRIVLLQGGGAEFQLEGEFATLEAAKCAMAQFELDREKTLQRREAQPFESTWGCHDA